MKKNILKFILPFIFSIGYSQVSEKPKTTIKDVIELIEKLKREGNINDNSVLILDEEIVLDINEIPDDQKFYNEIQIIKKGNKEMIYIYGARAVNGIIMIQSLPKTTKGNIIEFK